MKIIDNNLLNEVSSSAKASPRLRMNFNFHQSMEDKCHRMLNAVEPGTDIQSTGIQIKMNRLSSSEVKCALQHITTMVL